MKKYKVFVITSEGRLVHPEYPEGYGYTKSFDWEEYDTEEEAWLEVSKICNYYDEIIILPVYSNKRGI